MSPLNSTAPSTSQLLGKSGCFVKLQWSCSNWMALSLENHEHSQKSLVHVGLTMLPSQGWN